MTPFPSHPTGWQIVLADPPWRFKTHSPKGLEGRPQHYDRMDLDDIKALPVAEACAKDCALFLWVTSPHLAQGMKVLEAWGFTYKSSLCWGKERQGTGYWVRNQHEFVLVGSRGKFRVAPAAQRSSSLIMGQQRQHSRKPDAMHHIIEKGWPDHSKLELFARETRKGWAAWGAEAGKFDEVAA